MPKLDGTGPQGYGPRTGRGLGNCYCPRFGFRRFSNNIDLKEEEKILEEELKAVKKAIKDQK